MSGRALSRLAVAQAVARQAGDLLLAFRRDRLDIVVKGAQDFVAEADGRRATRSRCGVTSIPR